jgi:hypothetical protein
MPSLADIPEHILDSSDKQQLIDWLSKLPTDYQTRQALGVFWMRHTGTKLNRNDWKLISADLKPTKALNQYLNHN